MTATYKSDQRSNKGFIAALIGICLAGAAIIAAVITNDVGTSPPVPPQTAETAIDGDPLPAMPPGAVGITTPENDPAVGLTAPTITGTSYDGTEITVAADGTPKIVYFMAHWCQHCRAEAPRIQDIIDSGEQPDGLAIYTVSTSVNPAAPNYPPERWFEREGWSSPVIRDTEESDALLAYGAGGFPYAVYLDGNNTVIGRSAGELDRDLIKQAWDITTTYTTDPDETDEP